MPAPNILDKILAHKQTEIAARKEQCPESMLQERLAQNRFAISLANALSRQGLSVIAEIKKASPSAGVIREHFNPVAIAKAYVRAGTNAISMLTDAHFFQGAITFIEDVRPVVPVPILRKDFIIDPYQLVEAKAYGADAVLLIVAALDPKQLKHLLAKTAELGLEALVEVHSADEMQIAIDAGAHIIGINNRNLETFAIDLATTEQLVPLAPAGTVTVGESGIHTPEDIRRMIRAGVDAVLVGTHFMQHPDPGIALERFLRVCQAM
ncbi:indole-3-glycerol phosphate synthase TrpC [candidate division KSB3 bacterium]|uniref:Indole-3-glycerol phosphate synthase n=1 Tax=candidate division KSB3 bacterium TaxID=2044937 RepID=A0A9D5JYS6_9BACT|nr:indole-3-glycerol phosphate synthase TrpC [candidate division KSB3 bacterium]MBD3326287.1 indole-3-glycerol phosphate synthase TrpC [candidate division KSB3 bacterium]